MTQRTMKTELAPVASILPDSSGKQAWRRTKEYRQWVDDVKDNNDRTCQCCKRHEDELPEGVHLHAHHIRHATYFPKLKFTVENGISLCRYCHSKLHNKIAGGTRKKCDKVHVERLLNLRDYFVRLDYVAI